MTNAVPLPDDLTEEEGRRLLCNPWYCTNIHPALTEPRTDPPVAIEDWINSNATLIEKIGPAKWLTLLVAEMQEPHVPHLPYKSLR